MPWKPMLDPERDLKGATPTSLARALLRNKNLPTGVRKPVVRDEVAVEEVPADKPSDRVAHLDERV